ncbi:MAG: undecaprenyl-diphosphate phosphatase [bacterium]|nr:MAG: undecaprenyl-diphosphate phosphatase [bacterium]
MDLLKAIILGILQGLSEFLPISSSGHLVIAEYLLDFNIGGLAFEVFVHFGTLLAVLLVFRKDILNLIKAIPDISRLPFNTLPEERKEYALLAMYIILGSIPAALIGILMVETIEHIFENHILALAMLFVTGLIVWSSRYSQEKGKRLGAFSAVLIGIAQALAILPGISRSGSTIVTGLWMGLPRQQAARFSFLLSAPVIFGASILKLKDVVQQPLAPAELFYTLSATLAAGISGYIAIIWLLDVIKKQRLEWFGVYCIAVSLVGLILHFVI